MIVSESELVVRYAETDKMGIVHHSNYPVWFEVGRTDFIKICGLSYSQIEEKGLFFPLVELRCSYKLPARYEDSVIVKTRIKDMSGVRTSFEYEVVKKQDCSLIALGETIHVWTDKSLKPINLKKYDNEIYNLFSTNFR